MRAVTLNTTRAGMTRQRGKGGASPDTLFDLLNGYVGPNKAPKQRPGTRWKFTWPARTKGMVAFREKFYAFSAIIVATGNPLYVVETLRHPTPGFDGDIVAIHYAQPFLGYLYVVAEFDDGLIAHFWLREPQAWTANTAYLVTDSVQPTTPNGYYYQATAQITPPAWAPGVKRAVGDVVQPSVATGWKYTCTAVSGDNPVSGATEPTWPTTNDATVVEYVEAGPLADPGGTPPTNPNDPNDGRYNNPGGSGGGTRSGDRPQVRLF